MITSADNEKLKTIRKLQRKSWREKLGLFAAEGEDLVRRAYASNDFREGVSAFLEKRSPRWEDR